MFLMDVLYSIKKTNRLLKETERLLMSNVYLKVTIEKKWHTQNFNFLSLKGLSPGQILEVQFTQILLNFKNSCCNLKIRGVEEKLCYVSIMMF